MWATISKLKTNFLTIIKMIVIGSAIVACGGGQADGGNDGDTYGGIEISGGPLSVSILVNDDGEVILDTNVAIPLIGHEYLGVNLVLGYEKVIGYANTSEYKLYVVWRNRDGDVWLDEYDVRQKFVVNFSDKQLVKKIEGTGNGSFVVSVDVKRDSSQEADTSASNNVSCGSSVESKIKPNRTAYVCTQKDRLIIRDVPGGSEIFRLYPDEDVYIIGGPTCMDFATWWEIEIPSGTKATVGQTEYDDYFYTDRDVTGWVREGGDYTDPYYICQ